jgi:hypothetical protein
MLLKGVISKKMRKLFFELVDAIDPMVEVVIDGI